jgi:predicted flap endonuclease-1-like 5' DNA nuclease
VQKRERELLQQHAQEMDRLRSELQQQSSPADDKRINELLAEIQLRDDSIAVLRDDLAELNEQRASEKRGRQDDELRAAVGEARAWQDKYEAAASELGEARGIIEQGLSDEAKAWQEKYEAAAAELRERRLIEESGQQDERLRAAFDELHHWQEKYEAAAAELREKRSTAEGGEQDEQLRAAIDESLHWQEKYEAAVARLSRLGAAGPASEQDSPALPAYLRSEKVSADQRRASGGDRIGTALSHPGGHRDWLQEIKGIGPAIQRKLNDVGIYHFKQIAELDADDIARISNELGSFTDRIMRDDWIGQARALHRKYHE